MCVTYITDSTDSHRKPIDETETTPKTADELWNIDEEWESISPEPRAIASMQPASDTSSRPSTVAYSLASSRPVSTSSVSNYSQDTLKIYQDTLKIYQDTLKMYPPQASHPTGASSNEQVGSISQSTIDSPKTGLKIRLDSSRSFRGSRPALKGWKSDSSSPVSPTKRVSFAEVPEGRDVQGESPSEVAIEQEAVESLKADLDTGDVVQASESPEESSETSGKNESEAPFEVNIEHNEAVEETESIEAKDSHVDENITEAQIINVEHIPPGSFPLDSMPTHELASSLTDGNSLAHLACLFISHFRKILTPGPAVGFKRVWWNCVSLYSSMFAGPNKPTNSS